MNKLRVLLGIMIVLLSCHDALAHHIMGRPSYQLNEDSNTPPSMQIERQVGDYAVTYMVFPAFPRPDETGRINLYVARVDSGMPFQGRVRFQVRDDGWFESQNEVIGEQVVDDNVFRQPFLFRQAGDYIITASFDSYGEAYNIAFPLRIGEPSRIGVIGTIVGLIVLLLIGVNIAQRRRVTQEKFREAQHHE
ncbi:MAG: hypothetical protein R8J85_08115 [Mariprofundales bacterium]